MTETTALCLLAEPLEHHRSMTPRKLIRSAVARATGMMLAAGSTLAQQPPGVPPVAQGVPPVATFKSSVDLRRVSAVVRGKKGRFVSDLAARDVEVLGG